MGDFNVGKSSLMERFANNHFSTHYISTIGVDYTVKSCLIDEKRIQFQIWDTAGHERFRSVTSAFYRLANAAAIVFDKTNQQSFGNVGYWVEHLNKLTEDIPKVLVGNKCDLDTVISTAQGHDIAGKIGIKYIETSALSAFQVARVFEVIGRDLLERKTDFEHEERSILSSKKKNSCCNKM